MFEIAREAEEFFHSFFVRRRREFVYWVSACPRWDATAACLGLFKEGGGGIMSSE